MIAGKIIDNDGEPVARALVLALANRYYLHGRRGHIPRGAVPVMSNDLGEYRVGQLPPGKYIICAIPVGFYQPRPPGDQALKPTAEDADATTCYPNVPQMNEATQIEVRDGVEIPATDIRLRRTKTVTVQGRLTGVPASAGSATILNLNTTTSGPLGNVLHPRTMIQNADGRFEFKNVPAGTYILHTLPTGMGNAPYAVKAEIQVGDRPITDLNIPATIPFDLKAKLEAEPGPELKLASVRVILAAADEIIPALAMANANADGDIMLANVVAGRQRVTITGVPGTHYVAEIRAGNQLADGDEIDISSPTESLKIKLASSKSDVSGVVKDDKGNPVPAAYVALIPKPQRAYRFRVARTDQNGVFRLLNVPPGDFRLAAFDTVEIAALESDEFLKPYAAKLKSVTVKDGEPQTHELVVLAGRPD